MAAFEAWLTCDLAEGVTVTPLAGNVFSQDKLANKIGVIVTNNGTAVTLTGTVQGTIIRADETSVVVEGSKSSNRAWIVLPETAYAAVGAIQISIRIIDNGVKTTLGCCTGYVHRTMTGSVIDSGALSNLAVLPNLPTTNGTYSLKVTISNGSATYSWG